MSQKLHILILSAAMLLPAMGRADDGPDILRFFNTCAGQVAAHLSVHGWNANSGVTRTHLESIDAILAALAPPDQTDALDAQQSAARAAHVALLAHAMEYGDMDALNRARDHIAACRMAVLVP